MWLVTQHGFFNIIEQDDDKDKGLLTIKARRKGDLENIKRYFTQTEIEQSNITDYKFRLKGPVPEVAKFIVDMIYCINYDKTKVRLNEKHPDRAAIYFNAWAILCELQSETKPYLLKD